jgi:hypothetical protein
MNAPRENLDTLLRAVARGELDQLTPAQVAELEAGLNITPASEFAQQLAQPEPALAVALAAAAATDRPAIRTWDAMWDRIDAATTSSRVAPRNRLLRLWRPLAAVAAGLLFLAAWRVAQPPIVEPWPLQLATDTEIQSLEVYGDATPFVVSAGQNGSAIKVIWMLAEQS